MRNPELMCLGCMEELKNPQETCEKCGFNREEYEKKRNVRVLPSYTILAGKYLLGRVLGEGGFGVTYLAWDLNRECKVAIKEYFPSGLATRDTRIEDEESLTAMPGEKAIYYKNGLRNFAEEGKNLARFQHLEGIVSVRDFFQDNETAYIVMDYVEGENLKEYLKKYYMYNGEHTPLPEDTILKMMQPILLSLKEIHKAGIIHRDISPENIIFGWDGKMTLIDFGAARVATGTETKSLTIMLKHGYAPEEQYRSHGKQGAWTDIYAICATMYQMASGYLPVESIERMYEDKLEPLVNVNPRISKRFSEVVWKGMAVRGEQRYQSVEQMYAILYPRDVREEEETHEKKAQTVKEQEKRGQVKEEAKNTKIISDTESRPKRAREDEKISYNFSESAAGRKNFEKKRGVQVVVVIILVIILSIGCFWRPVTSNSSEKDGNIVAQDAGNNEDSGGETEDALPQKEDMQWVLGIWDGQYTGMSNQRKIQKKIRFLVSEYKIEDDGESVELYGVAEIEGGKSGYYYIEGIGDGTKELVFEEKAWLSENPDNLKMLRFHLFYDSTTDSMEGFIEQDPERTIQLTKKDENGSVLYEYWNNHEELIKKYVSEKR